LSVFSLVCARARSDRCVGAAAGVEAVELEAAGVEEALPPVAANDGAATAKAEAAASARMIFFMVSGPSCRDAAIRAE